LLLGVRYLLGVDDAGQAFDLSPDPMIAYLQETMGSIKLGDEQVDISSILSNESIFTVNLYTAGLGEKVEQYFLEMIQGPGGVTKTLEKYLN
jgi:fructuronate reductase